MAKDLVIRELRLFKAARKTMYESEEFDYKSESRAPIIKFC